MENFRSIFEQFNHLNIMVVGDIMIDRYLSGKVTRISPEAPVPVVALESRENRLGGAANVALNIKALGANPILISVVGNDNEGAIFKKILPENGISSDFLHTSNSRKTTVKTRVLAASQQLLRVDAEDTHSLSGEETKELKSIISNQLDSKKVDAILLQDYNKGVLTQELIEFVIKEAQKRQIPTAVDPKKDNFWAYKGVTLFKPNLKEIRESMEKPVQTNSESLLLAGKHIRHILSNTFSMITLSEKGVFYDEENQSGIIPTIPRSIADVSGAGDTVISVATLGLACNLDIRTIAILSNLAGGQVCEKVGVVPVDKKLLLEEALELLVQKA
ncbi:MAG: bifunctional ADP-heptose synthase [Saprospiraceae bacterium]